MIVIQFIQGFKPAGILQCQFDISYSQPRTPRHNSPSPPNSLLPELLNVPPSPPTRMRQHIRHSIHQKQHRRQRKRNPQVLHHRRNGNKPRRQSDRRGNSGSTGIGGTETSSRGSSGQGLLTSRSRSWVDSRTEEGETEPFEPLEGVVRVEDCFEDAAFGRDYVDFAVFVFVVVLGLLRFAGLLLRLSR